MKSHQKKKLTSNEVTNEEPSKEEAKCKYEVTSEEQPKRSKK